MLACERKRLSHGDAARLRHNCEWHILLAQTGELEIATGLYRHRHASCIFGGERPNTEAFSTLSRYKEKSKMGNKRKREAYPHSMLVMYAFMFESYCKVPRLSF